MNKQKLLDELNKFLPKQGTESSYFSGARAGIELAITLVEELEEPEKVVIPQFVANYIELCKGGNGDRQAYTEDNSELWFALGGDSCGMPNSVSDWLFNEEKVETFARAWLDGYEIEKKKLYYVINDAQQLMLANNGNIVPTLTNFEVAIHQGVLKKYQLTEKEIKEYNARYWPFAVEVTE